MNPHSDTRYWMDSTVTSWRHWQVLNVEKPNKKCSMVNGPFCGYLQDQLATKVQYPGNLNHHDKLMQVNKEM